MCDPPGVVGVEPSVVLDLLHPRSAGSSSLALPLRPDVRFTACASVHEDITCLLMELENVFAVISFVRHWT